MKTTLCEVIPWAVVAGLAWGLWLLGQGTVLVCDVDRWAGRLDRLSYLAAVLSLCPPMMVLGARRPTNRAWVGFVIVPMFAVLCWPVVTLAFYGAWDRPLELEPPQLVGFLLVVIMSYGNYIGGRLTFPALLIGTALTMCVLDLSQLAADRSGRVENLVALIVLATGVVIACRRLRLSRWPADPLDRVWQEFCTLFGLVWSRRVMDRVNLMAEKQQWPVRLHADGFHWDRPGDDASRARVEHALQWLLRRFVDVEWLDARLGPAGPTNLPLSIDT